MVTETFRDWFKEFVKEVKERPLLIIWDGRLTHVSVDVIIKANTEGLKIVKYPPYVTDQLQPLHVTCFGPLKRKWELLFTNGLLSGVLNCQKQTSLTCFQMFGMKV